MESRRDFLKKASLLTGTVMFWSVPDSLLRAMAISPDPGTTFLDAEHIVILMQENRAFDHSYGTLSGVRGYRDPRVHRMPNGNAVWLQTSKEGKTYAPFRLNIKETSITWLGGLPHNWDNQVDARNNGRYDKWLIVKPANYKPLRDQPMTLGHYTRDDIPFYYALADAFTICDQHFCSSLTGTTPNRLYLWTGTIRAEQDPGSKPHVFNEETTPTHTVSWTPYAERLSKAGVTWKVYQNQISLGTGLVGEEARWLGNFGCNPLECFTQFSVRSGEMRRAYVEKRIAELPGEISALKAKQNTAKSNSAKKDKTALRDLETELAGLQLEVAVTPTIDQLPSLTRDMHDRAFTINSGDPLSRTLASLHYEDENQSREMSVPAGDVLHQFREDVKSGNLPTVSWLVGPEHFSDHPSSAWFGAWYVSEALDILTQNPELWKKTIFILTYDENDGYYDHVPPFVSPNPYKEDCGKVSDDIDAKVEFVTKEQDLAFRPTYSPRESSLGLGYRVPMVVASPWTRGGCVNSQVFDHTSVIQFLETFLANKTGNEIKETNISSWRRAVCGDMTTLFQDAAHDQGKNPKFLNRDKFVEKIDKAKYQKPPSGFQPLDEDQIQQLNANPSASPFMPEQERGTRPSCPLPYELYADGRLLPDGSGLELRLEAAIKLFGGKASGSPFNVYAYQGNDQLQARAYAVSAGDALTDTFKFADFAGGHYHVRVDGPNGFMREFKGDASKPGIDVKLKYDVKSEDSGRVQLILSNAGEEAQTAVIRDAAYGQKAVTKSIPAGGEVSLVISAKPGQGWYDLQITLSGNPSFLRQAAGKIEIGKWGVTDPAMA